MDAKMRAALFRARDELLSLSPEEFQARLDAAKKSDLYATIRYALDPNWDPDAEGIADQDRGNVEG